MVDGCANIRDVATERISKYRNNFIIKTPKNK
jgi:hypothetical protein